MSSEHGLRGYRGGCRCPECQYAAGQLERRRRRAERAAEDAPHGTPGAYMNWSCRCDSCVTVYRTYLRERRQTKGY